MGNAEWRATDDKGQLTELPLAIELKDFTIDEYPPKLMLIDNETGRALPEKSPVHLLLEEEVYGGTLQDWETDYSTIHSNGGLRSYRGYAEVYGFSFYGSNLRCTFESCEPKDRRRRKAG